MKPSGIKQLIALFAFDLSRVRILLWIWWGLCLVQVGLAVAILYGHANDLVEPIHLFLYPINFLFIAILVGAFLRPCRPGSQWSYFRGMTIPPSALLSSRLLLIVVAVLFPLYLSRLVPLIRVAPEFDAISAYTVFYWGIHLGVVACAGAIATASQKTSNYLLCTFLAAVGLAFIAGLTSQLAFRESNWIRVASPEGAELLWQSGLCLVGALSFCLVIRALYLGRSSWKLGITAITLAVAIAALLKPIRFIHDWKNSGHEISADLIDVSKLSFETKRAHGYRGQMNTSPGSYSGVSRSTPPYYDGREEWNTNDERFWFIGSSITVQNLDPEVSFSPRLLEARWVAPEGEVVLYEPPSGTYSVNGSDFLPPPPGPTHARLEALLGPEPEGSYRPKHSLQSSQIIAFGAWTSVYEKFKTTPGRLEIRVRLDFYQHEIGERLPLNQIGAISDSKAMARITKVTHTNDEIETQFMRFQESKRWSRPIGSSWVSGWNWMLHDPTTGWRPRWQGSGSGGRSIFESVLHLRQDSDVRKKSDRGEPAPTDNFDSLQLLQIVPRYLGSTEVELTVEDFALVTEDEIKSAQRDDLRNN